MVYYPARKRRGALLPSKGKGGLDQSDNICSESYVVRRLLYPAMVTLMHSDYKKEKRRYIDIHKIDGHYVVNIFTTIKIGAVRIL